MNRVEFQKWFANHIDYIDRADMAKLTSWRLKMFNELLKEKPFNALKAETFTNMVKFDLDLDLYFNI